MAAEPQDFEPEKLTAGVTWKWKKTHSDYVALTAHPIFA